MRKTRGPAFTKLPGRIWQIAFFPAYTATVVLTIISGALKNPEIMLWAIYAVALPFIHIALGPVVFWWEER